MLFRDATNIADSQPPATCRQRYVSVYGIVACTIMYILEMFQVHKI